MNQLKEKTRSILQDGCAKRKDKAEAIREFIRASAAENTEPTAKQVLEFAFEEYIGKSTNASSSSSSANTAAEFPLHEFEIVVKNFLDSQYGKSEIAVDRLLESFVLAHLDLAYYFLVFLGNVFKRTKQGANKTAKGSIRVKSSSSTNTGRIPLCFNVEVYYTVLQKTGTFLMARGHLDAPIDEEEFPLFVGTIENAEKFKGLKRVYAHTFQDFLKAIDANGKHPLVSLDSYDQKELDAMMSKLNAAKKRSEASDITSLGAKKILQIENAKSEKLIKQLLLHLTNVFQYMENPTILAQFFLTQFDRGSLEIQICALSGLVYLSTEKNLEFEEDYYERLYTLLTPEIFQFQYRLRFQRILAASLVMGGDNIPGTQAASFAKKLLRVAASCSENTTANGVITTTPHLSDIPSICWCIGLAYNIMKKYPSTCRGLLHRDGSYGFTKEDPWTIKLDLRRSSEVIATSSMWELEVLIRHHHPQVSRLTHFFANPNIFKRTTEAVDVSVFLDANQAEFLQKEIAYKRKKDYFDVGADVSFAFLPRPRNAEIEGTYQVALSMLKRRKIG